MTQASQQNQSDESQKAIARAAELGIAIKAMAPEAGTLVAELVELATRQASEPTITVAEHRRMMRELNAQATKPPADFPLGVGSKPANR